MKDYDYLSNPDDGTYSVLVPAHTEHTRRLAAEEVAGAVEGFGSDDTERAAEAIRWLTSKAEAVSFTQHASPPDEDSCDCEAKGWWCESPGNGGPTHDFWHFDGADIEDARERAEEDEEDAAPDLPSSST